MTLVRRATLICAVGLLVAGAAMAGVPSASTSIVAPGIALVGYANPADPTVFGNAVFTIKDASGNVVPGSVVILNFSSCSDIKLCSSSAVPVAGITVNCAAKTATGVTNATGQVTFKVVGASNNTGGVRVAPRDGAAQGDANQLCVGVTADGVALPSINASAFDLTGDSFAAGGPGVGASDLFIWGGDFAAGDFGRSDYDSNLDDGANDLFEWGQVFGGSNSALGCHDCQP